MSDTKIKDLGLRYFFGDGFGLKNSTIEDTSKSIQIICSDLNVDKTMVKSGLNSVLAKFSLGLAFMPACQLFFSKVQNDGMYDGQTYKTSSLR